MRKNTTTAVAVTAATKLVDLFSTAAAINTEAAPAATAERRTIADKRAALRKGKGAVGVPAAAVDHLIHGTGGSPRRAAKAIKGGYAEACIELYTLAFAATQSHSKSVALCNIAWPVMARNDKPNVALVLQSAMAERAANVAARAAERVEEEQEETAEA